MQIRKFFAVAALISLAPLAGGCGGSSKGQVKVYPVTGKVTMGGAPLANASVSFSPQDKQPIAIGRTNSEGVYHLTTYDANDGAAEGKFIVLVMKTGAPAATPRSEDEEHAAMEAGDESGAQHGAGQDGADDDGPTNLLNRKYSSPATSDLDATVKPDGDNTFDFTLDQ